MKLTKLVLKNYRNYEDFEYRFSKNKTLIIGKNAQGKTNILEAIFYLCALDSARIKKDSELIQFQKDMAQIETNEDGLYCFTIKPEDTETLDYGEYSFDVEVTLKNGYRKTKVDILVLEPETTFHGGEEDGN